ncbi:hypothetical protein EZV62_013556 [Acer yangbiense]|uniref:Uncharacterized protein n=1 Tax=Acer yangbiense TaxID=1000413 RepID=A0A5C7HYG5_9ROSI|nr:hypothetical protein EZV62_013556 [Acer yangbiense]
MFNGSLSFGDSFDLSEIRCVQLSQILITDSFSNNLQSLILPACLIVEANRVLPIRSSALRVANVPILVKGQFISGGAPSGH